MSYIPDWATTHIFTISKWWWKAIAIMYMYVIVACHAFALRSGCVVYSSELLYTLTAWSHYKNANVQVHVAMSQGAMHNSRNAKISSMHHLALWLLHNNLKNSRAKKNCIFQCQAADNESFISSLHEYNHVYQVSTPYLAPLRGLQWSRAKFSSQKLRL